MRKYYLDNIRWATVLAVVFYHVLFMYNHTLTSGVAGAVTDFAGQDALQYLLYPWFMVVLFLVSGACTRYKKYGSQKGWERVNQAPPEGDGFQEITEEEARQMELPF